MTSRQKLEDRGSELDLMDESLDYGLDDGGLMVDILDWYMAG